jgi:dipeptidyl aminopeptidase/acylaminoacyl peptidase
MKRMHVAAVLAAGLAVAAPGPAGDPAGWTPEMTFKVKRVGTVRVSPDGGRAAFVVGTAVMDGEKSEWVSQVHVARADGSGAFQLTRSEKSSTAPAWSPDGAWIAFVAARGDKDAKPNLWRIRVDGGEAEALTQEKGVVSAPAFSPDGRWIAFLATDPKGDDEEKADKERRDARVLDENEKMARLHVVPAEPDAEGKRNVRKLTTGPLHVGEDFAWSPDSRSIAFTHQPTPAVDDWTRSDVSVVDVAAGAVRTLAATQAAESQPRYSPDGRSIALTVSDSPPSWGGRRRVHVVPAEGGTPRPLALTHDEQPEIVGWLKDGRRVLVGEWYGTTGRRLSTLAADGSPRVDISPPGTMVEGASLNAARTRIGFTSQAADAPTEAFFSDVEPFAPRPLGRVQTLPTAPIGKTEVVTWKAPDGKTIEGLLTYPVGYAAGQRVPLLVIIHGGPAGVFVQTFVGAPSPYPVAVFAGRGYAVLRCNVRGSSGYGADFRRANYRDWGGGDYRDIVSGVDALVARGIADPDRLGVMGWSYGGYMTSWVITQTKRFKAASVGAGVTNLMSFAGTTDIPSFIPDYFGGEHWDAFDAWRTHSAMFNIKGVATPTLIQHGEADLRVPISQGYELYNALKRQGVPVKMVVYPRQPHGIQEPKLMLDAMSRNVEWFDRWVLGQDRAAGRP